jgi:hypothetical protein
MVIGQSKRGAVMARDTIVAGVVVAAIALGSWSFASPPRATTRLIIEISGGFAYVPDPGNQHLHVAYLEDVFVPPDTDTNHDMVIDANDEPVCDVKQIGTELMVVRGTITDSRPTTPGNRTYNLKGAKVTFPDLNGPAPTFVRTLPTPTNVTAPAAWTDVQFVPSIKEFHAGNSRIIPLWRTKVNGFITLRGGAFVGAVPTDPLVASTYFEFKQNGVLKGTSAVTDKIIYTVDVPEDHVEIRFSGSSYGFSRLTIAPTAPGMPVRLRLRGLHSMGSAASYANGDEIKDFCAFYSLFKASPTAPEPTPMSSSSRLKMFLVNTTPPLASGGQPSPGFFCDGIWF